MDVRLANDNDWEDIKNIYLLGIETKKATFEKAPPNNFDEWSKKFDQNNIFIHESNSEINGWIALSPYSSRCCYEGVGEVSVYVHPNSKRKGIATQLYKHLEVSAIKSGYWTIQAQLFTTNDSSKALFDSLGFREVGIRKNIGKLDEVWIDNYLLEKNINLN